MEAPQNPAGIFAPKETYSAQERNEFIAVIENAPTNLRKTTAGLSRDQLETRYRNWTIRQIVHHIPDSHLNSYVRYKWALTEVLPTIKAYDEGAWAALEDSRTGDIRYPLDLLEALHARWVQLLRSMSDEQFDRSFIHPQTGQAVSLSAALGYYAWHCQHHTAQITWLRRQHGW
jgi:uncharacterized damage-inducible protein DinB